MESSYTSPSTRPIYKGVQVVWYILGIMEALLAFRFALKLLAANPASGFVSFIYGITWPFAQPFIAVFRQTRLEGSIFEWTTLLAMVVYWLLALAIIRLLLIGRPISTREAAHKLEREEDEDEGR